MSGVAKQDVVIAIARDHSAGLHEQIDDAVAEAYGWPLNLSEEDILFRLVDLNAVRAGVERDGTIRWLRPEFQRIAEVQGGLEMDVEEVAEEPTRSVRLPWPATLPERVRAVRSYLMSSGTPSSPSATR